MNNNYHKRTFKNNKICKKNNLINNSIHNYKKIMTMIVRAKLKKIMTMIIRVKSKKIFKI